MYCNSTFQMHTMIQWIQGVKWLVTVKYVLKICIQQLKKVNMDFKKLKLFFFIEISIWQRHGYSASHRHIDENARQPKISPSASKMTGSHTSLAVSASAGLPRLRVHSRPRQPHSRIFDSIWLDLLRFPRHNDQTHAEFTEQVPQ